MDISSQRAARSRRRRWRALAEIAVRPFKLLAQCGKVSGQLLDGGLVLLAFLFGSTELLAKINLRLRHRFNSLMHLTEALIVGFLALAENAHHAGNHSFPNHSGFPAPVRPQKRVNMVTSASCELKRISLRAFQR
jgi:hypothetical protein